MKTEDPLEFRIASCLRAAGIEFIHESENKLATKGLDFFLPKHNIYLEIKGGHSDRIAKQMARDPNVIAIQGMQSVQFLCGLLIQ